MQAKWKWCWQLVQIFGFSARHMAPIMTEKEGLNDDQYTEEIVWDVGLNQAHL